MKILIDIGHPAHVHLFRNMIKQLQTNGHTLLITARDKEVTRKLLKYYRIDFLSRPSSKNGVLHKALGIFKITFCLWKHYRHFKADILIGGVGNAYISLLGFITGKPAVIFDDTEHSKYELLFVNMFSNVIICPDCYTKNLGKKQIRYSGYHELAYLHLNQFTPDKNILNELGIKEGESYFILRFVSWNASHDIGQGGLSLDVKKQLIDILGQHGKVFISSERKLDTEFEQYRFILPPEKMHDALAFTDLFIGEGATMASECAMLGTPAIYVNSLSSGTLEEQEKYGLIYGYRNSDGVLEKVKELLQILHLKEEYQTRRNNMLEDKIDVTAFMVWFIENYPESKKIMKENPDYQYKFK